MSGLTFLIGRANAGQTDALYRTAAAHAKRGERALVIVPEQATFAAERRLADIAGAGLIGVQVLSVERLSERILENSSRRLPYLSGEGVAMAVRRVAEIHGGTLSAFSRAVTRSGFCTELAELFSEMKRALIAPEQLRETAARLPDGTLLKEKLTDLSILYAATEAFFKERYLSPDDRMNAAIRLLPASFAAGAFLYFDGLPAMTRQFHALMDALLSAAAGVTVAETEDPSGADEALFAVAKSARTLLSTLAEEKGLPVRTQRFSETQTKRRALLHLERSLFSYPYPEYDGEDDGSVTVFGAPSRYAETEAVADAICHAVRGGARYRELAVVLSDPERYSASLRRSLDLRGIPYFLDAKRPLLLHAAGEFVLLALTAVTEGFSPEIMLRLAKSGYAGVCRDGAEALENFVLRTGIRGSAFLAPFKRADAESEHARETLMAPLLRLREALHGRTVKEKLAALYAYLMEIGLSEQLAEHAEALAATGRPVEAEEHAALWKAITALFDQLYAILGDTAMSRDDFLQLLSEGLASASVGVIPDTADRVLVGDPVRTRLPAGVRRLFVLGANEGLLPASRTDDALIDSRELDLLSENGLPVWNKPAYGAAIDTLRLYALFAAPTDALFVTYSFASDAGELSPAPVVTRLLRMFPACSLNEHPERLLDLPETERTGLRLLASLLREDALAGSESPMTAALLAYFSEHPRYAALAENMAREAGGRIRPARVAPALAEALYGTRMTMSPSRLELYNACPFRHFAEAGLRAQPRQEAGERPAELGAFYHAALEAFLRRCMEESVSYRTLTDERIDLMLDELLPTVIALHNDGALLENERLRMTLFLLVETVRQSARAIVRQLAAGRFRPAALELRFGNGAAFPPIRLDLGNGRTALLTGVVDRLDRASLPDGTEALRVIDYKSGGKKLDFGAVLDGLCLQLPLYLAAVTAAGGVPGGMYYMPVRVALPDSGADAAAELQKRFRLAGLTLEDPAVLECTEEAMQGASAVLAGVRKKQDGSCSGAVCGGTELLHLMREAKRIAERTGSAMLSGNVAVSPISGACEYCDYRSVCRFDAKLPSCRTRKKRRLDREAFFDTIGRKGGDGDAMD